MSIETDLKRLADAAEGILAHLTGKPVQKRGPGRPPRSAETVDPAPTDDAGETGTPEGAAAASSAATAQTQAASKTATQALPVPTLDEVKARAKAILSAGKRDALLALLTKHGGQSPSTLPEANRAAFYAEAEALLPEGAK